MAEFVKCVAEIAGDVGSIRIGVPGALIGPDRFDGLAFRHVAIAEIIKGIAPVRPQGEGFFAGGDGLVVALEIVERIAEVVMDFRHLRRRFERPLEAGNRGLRCAGEVLEGAELKLRFGIGRKIIVQRLDALQHSGGITALPHHARQSAQGIGLVEVTAQALAITGYRIGKLACASQRIAEIDPRACPGGIEMGGLLEQLRGLLALAPFEPEMAEVVVSLDVASIARNGFAQSGVGLISTVEGVKRRAEIAPSLNERGFMQGGLAIMADRVLDLALGEAEITQVRVRLGVIRRRRKHFLIARCGVGGTSRLVMLHRRGECAVCLAHARKVAGSWLIFRCRAGRFRRD